MVSLSVTNTISKLDRVPANLTLKVVNCFDLARQICVSNDAPNSCDRAIRWRIVDVRWERAEDSFNGWRVAARTEQLPDEDCESLPAPEW